MPHICSQKQINKMETYSNIAKSKADKQVFVASGRNPSRTRSKSATKSVSLQQMQPYFSDKLMSCARKSHFLPFIFWDCYSQRTEGFQSSEVSAFVSRGIRSVKRSSGSNLTASRPDFLGSWGGCGGTSPLGTHSKSEQRLCEQHCAQPGAGAALQQLRVCSQHFTGWAEVGAAPRRGGTGTFELWAAAGQPH